eukprot:9145452-Alexandrium_andersonii.AAC.1
MKGIGLSSFAPSSTTPWKRFKGKRTFSSVQRRSVSAKPGATSSRKGIMCCKSWSVFGQGPNWGLRC